MTPVAYWSERFDGALGGPVPGGGEAVTRFYLDDAVDDRGRRAPRAAQLRMALEERARYVAPESN
jgi:hypothetical protein